MPSIYEMTSYFSRDSERQCHATAYARAAGVSNNGYIFYKGDPIDTMDDTVQPMIRIQLSSSCNHNWLPASSTYSDGSSITCTLRDTMQLQTIVLSDFIATNSLRITINSVYPGTDYADIGISDVFYYLPLTLSESKKAAFQQPTVIIIAQISPKG